jgi:hypothetical protein
LFFALLASAAITRLTATDSLHFARTSAFILEIIHSTECCHWRLQVMGLDIPVSPRQGIRFGGTDCVADHGSISLPNLLSCDWRDLEGK